MTSDRLIDCPHCKQWVSCNESSTNQVAKCTGCGKTFHVPAAPPPAPIEARLVAAIRSIRPDTGLLQQILDEQVATNNLLRKLISKDDMTKQTRILKNIQSHVRITAWCVFILLLASGFVFIVTTILGSAFASR
jgi:hypothetical protein